KQSTTQEARELLRLRPGEKNGPFEDLAEKFILYSNSVHAKKAAIENQKKEIIGFRIKYLQELYYAFKQYGLHKEIGSRAERQYAILFKTTSNSKYIKWDLSKSQISKDYISKYDNVNNTLLVDGQHIKIKEISQTYIVKYPFKIDEISFYCASKGIVFDNSMISKEQFIYTFSNLADDLLPRDIQDNSLDVEVLNAAIDLKHLLISHKSFKGNKNELYKKLRLIICNNAEAWALAPSLIKDYHSFDEFWANKHLMFEIKSHISSQFWPMINFLETKAQPLINISVQSALNFLNAEQVTKYWEKSIQNIDLDPEEAISRSKTLLETIFKQILDSERIEYNNYTIDFPQLYKAVADNLKLSPGGQHEKIFNQILNGCKSVVEGVNAARGKWGSAHGKNEEQMKNLPSKRHAELVVNLSGAMAMFLIKAWKDID
ncbi:MAG: abortive infection family protein, partial [Methanobacterium sp.]